MSDYDDAKMRSALPVESPVPAARAPRRRYQPPTVSDYGPLHRVTLAGATSSESDFAGMLENMAKLTMVG